MARYKFYIVLYCIVYVAEWNAAVKTSVEFCKVVYSSVDDRDLLVQIETVRTLDLLLQYR